MKKLLAFLCGPACVLGAGAFSCGGPSEEGPGSSGTSPQAGTTSSSSSGRSVDPNVDSGTPGDSGTPAGCSGKTGQPGSRTITVKVGGDDRTFDLHVPPKYTANKASPLVFVFHGYTMTKESIASVTTFSAASDARNFIVAFPQGTSNGFNAGECCGPAVSNKIDDVGFTKETLKKIEAEYCVDAKHVHSTGFSNGGFMSYRLACEMADTFASVASVAGTLGVPPDTCTPKRPVPLMHVHGTSDVIVPYDGGGIGGNRSVDVSVGAFRAKNACASSGAPAYSKGDVSCTQWGGCKDDADVKLCTVQNGAHAWPGGVGVPYAGTKDLDATNAIVDFFEAHGLK